jgi:hypothetical protein
LIGSAAAAPREDLTDTGPGPGPATGEPRAMPDIPSGGASELRPETVELPTVEYDPEQLPTPVRRLREQIMDAAKTGDPEQLKAIIDANGEPPAFSYNDIGDDPIAYLRSLSADPEGREILAILIEILEAGYVHVGEGTPDEMYVWPYFAHYPVDRLSGPQIVELLKIVYPGDYEDMRVYGTYLFYRVGLAPDGTWRYFIVSD